MADETSFITFAVIGENFQNLSELRVEFLIDSIDNSFRDNTLENLLKLGLNDVSVSRNKISNFFTYFLRRLSLSGVSIAI